MAAIAGSMNWEDLQLEGIAWADDGRALVIRMREAGGERCRIVTLRWAQALQLKLGLPEGRGGYPMTWDGEVRSLADGHYSLLLDFASDGEIRAICSEIDVEIVER